MFYQKYLQTLRGRLTAWYLAFVICLFTLIVVIFSFFFYFTLQDQIDHHVHVAINEARQIIEIYPLHQRAQRLRDLTGSQGMTVVLLSADGYPILQTNSPNVARVTEHQLQQVISAGDKKVGDEPTHFSVGEVRFATVAIDDDGGGSLLAVGYSTNLLRSTFRNLLLIIGGVLFVSLIVLSFVTRWFLQYNLIPLERISAVAKKITNSHDLSKSKIEVLPTTTELREISLAFNQMLSKLNQVFQIEHQFFSDTAHTLKTPLAVLRSEVENLDLRSAQTKKSLLESIDQTVGLVQDLLFISKIQTSFTYQMKRESISKLVMDLSDLARVLGQAKNLEIKKNIETEIYLEVNKTILIKAIGNIVKNAVEHSKKNGVIKFELDKKDEEICLKIIDTGVGINREDLPEVFTRFFRGGDNKIKNNNGKKNSSGLGLAISKAIVESLGGKIKVSSEINKGTIFTITLPSL